MPPLSGLSQTEQVVHIVDDDSSFRTAVARLLRAGDYKVREYPSATAFLAKLQPESHGCVLADLRMPDHSGLDLQKALLDVKCAMPVIFLSGHGTISATVQAMRGGAEDFLTKPVSREALFSAVERAFAHAAEERERVSQAADWSRRLETLTQREMEVLRHVIAGRMNKQIAFSLGVSERTIKAHRASVVEKLEVRSVADLVRMAEAVGLKAVV